MSYIKRFISVLAVLLILTGCSMKTEKPDKVQIIASNFPEYDFARQITGDFAEVKMLLSPGVDSHSFEPSPKDIISISNCDLFIYTGGESDEWIETILASLEKKPKTIKITDFVEILTEDSIDGNLSSFAEEDEHVWTSPLNAVKITEGISKTLCGMYPKQKELFAENCEKYTKELKKLDRDFETVCKNSKRKTLVFGDRFPFRYFAKRYNLDYVAAYQGCSSETEPGAKMIAYLNDKIKEEKIPVVLYIEFSNRKIADSVSESTGTKTSMLHSCHNVTKEQLENSVTYIELMKDNLKVIKDALN